MFNFAKSCFLFVLMNIALSSAIALEPTDRSAIEKIIQDYTTSWNFQEGKGFADGFTEDADFVNIFGMIFSGKSDEKIMIFLRDHHRQAS